MFLLSAAAVSISRSVEDYQARQKNCSKNEDCSTYTVSFGFLARLCKTINDNSPAITALSGVAVAAFTFTLWRSTEKLWDESRAQRVAVEKQRVRDEAQRRRDDIQKMRESRNAREATRASVRQAVASERTLIASNRPHLIFRTSFDRKTLFDIDVNTIPYLEYGFHNYGTSPAIIQESFADIVVINTIIPANYVEDEFTVFHYNILNPGEPTSWTRVTRKAGPLLTSEKIAINNGESFVFAVGRTIYTGVLGSKHETRFCWIYEPKHREFHEYGGPDYNLRT